MSSNQFMIDASTRHQVFIQRFAGGEVKEIQKYLNEVEQYLLTRLLKARTEFQADRLQSQLKDVRAFIVATYDKMGEHITDTAKEFGPYEAEFASRMIAKGTAAVITDLSLPAASQINAAILAKPMDLVVGTGTKKTTIKKALSSFSRKSATRSLNVIRDGFLMGETNLEITRKVQDILDIQRSQAESLTRTIINHTGSVGRAEFYKENDDVIEAEEWVSVLDNRVTAICASRDGNKYPVGKGPYPPAHFRCRSIRTPIVNPKYNLGAGITGTRASKGAEGGKQVSANTTFGPWLKSQPASFQKEYFKQFPDGESRYKLFSKGNLSIKNFVDSKGETLTLSELRKLEPVAFERAGI